MSIMVYGGLDVHHTSISACLLQPDTGEFFTDELANNAESLQRAVRRWARMGELRLCYEASSGGYVVKRWLDRMGVSCEVIAPSRVPRAPGERVKTDRRDAQKLARYYAAGLLQTVRVPSEEEEVIRALVRLREGLTRDMTRCKNRALKYLALLGHRYGGRSNWTRQHRDWLHRLDLGADQRLVLQSHLDTLDELTARRQGIDVRIAEVAQSSAYATPVEALMSLRGVGVFTAMVLITEIGDIRRFGTAPELMSYLGLVPGEHSSGDKRRQGAITKTGSSRARWVLQQAAWNQTTPPGHSRRLQAHWQSQPAEVVAIAKRAERRLHRRYWRLAMRKDRNTAATAVARELAGFVWAMLSAVAA